MLQNLLWRGRKIDFSVYYFGAVRNLEISGKPEKPQVYFIKIRLFLLLF